MLLTGEPGVGKTLTAESGESSGGYMEIEIIPGKQQITLTRSMFSL